MYKNLQKCHTLVQVSHSPSVPPPPPPAGLADITHTTITITFSTPTITRPQGSGSNTGAHDNEQGTLLKHWNIVHAYTHGVISVMACKS